MGVISSIVFFLEFIRVQSIGMSILMEEAFRNLLVYALGFPLLGGVALSLVYEKTRLTRTVHEIGRQRNLIHELANAKDWNELTSLILQIPRILGPIVGSSLYVYSPTNDRYELADAWTGEEFELPYADPSPNLSYCSLALHNQDINGVCVPCICLMGGESREKTNGFCLPLINRQKQIAVLFLFFSRDRVPTREQTEILIELAPELALAIERMQLRNSLDGQSSAVIQERNRISRYLHDTLGHDLAYIRLKLDQISHEGKMDNNDNLNTELVNLREVADQSYERLRTILTELRKETTVDFLSAITEYAESIGERSGIEVQVRIDGDPLKPTNFIQRQALYILREILNNAEKHADATHIDVNLSWGDKELTVEAVDNGCGFDPGEAIMKGDHYGLEIIQECVAEINGELTVQSVRGEGTRVRFWVPIDVHE